MSVVLLLSGPFAEKRGLSALVSECDFEMLSAYRWSAAAPDKNLPNSIYACSGGNGSIVWMHRLILGAGRGQQVDHINHTGLDNRRENLRICSQSQNNANARWKLSSTGYRGVYPSKQRFRAQIWHNSIPISLGSYGDPAEAARAYDEAAARIYGEFATLNFPAQKAA